MLLNILHGEVTQNLLDLVLIHKVIYGLLLDYFFQEF
jgi:hypothetical protein